MGTSLAEAIEAFAWREPFSELVNDIRAAHPEAFAGSGVTPGPSGAPWIAFDDAAPTDAVLTLESSPMPVTVVEGKGFTERELSDLVTDIHYRIYESPYAAEVISAYDPVTGMVETSVVPQDTTATRGQVRTQVMSLLTLVERARFALRIVDDISAGFDAVYGGGKLSSCTAGFTVVNGSTRGLSTAGHCSNTQSYSGAGALTFKAAHEGVWGDVQWHTSLQYESDDFYYNFGALRDTSAVSFANPGLRVCRFGQTTGARCDYVFRLNQCWDGRCHLTSTELRQASGGDSGGPWYFGGTAYGIHSGFVGLPGDERDSFTPSTYLDEAIAGLRVATG